jgi:hypothetical protein
MQTITIAIKDNSAIKKLKELEERHFISIVGHDSFDSPAIPGPEISLSKFKKWVNDAEQTHTVSLDEAKAIWQTKRKQLQRLAR